jgi:hypothetical protein
MLQNDKKLKSKIKPTGIKTSNFTVMNKSKKTKVPFLLVIKNGNYFGFISKSIALEACKTKLRSMTIK